MIKVSVGIPTFNRPLGLQRTLEQITSQSYENLDIIVSDNGTPGENGKKNKEILENFSSKDNRIRYYIQPENIGMANNFKFVLEKAKEEYFMWAADDDEWDKDYIFACTQSIGNAGLAFPSKFYVHWRKIGKIENKYLDYNKVNGNTYDVLLHFLKIWTSNIIYGLFKTKALRNILYDYPELFFDWGDCFIIIKMILDYGINIFNVDKSLYGAGIDDENYILKPHNKQNGKIFTYTPFLINTIEAVTNSENLTNEEKANTIVIFLQWIKKTFSNFEKDSRPDSVEILNMVKDILIDNRIKESITSLFANKKIIIYGTGKYCTNVIEKVKYDEFFSNIIAFCDSDKSKHNTNFFGKKIISPEQLSNFDYDYILIASPLYEQEIKNILNDIKIPLQKIFTMPNVDIAIDTIYNKKFAKNVKYDDPR